VQLKSRVSGLLKSIEISRSQRPASAAFGRIKKPRRTSVVFVHLKMSFLPSWSLSGRICIAEGDKQNIHEQHLSSSTSSDNVATFGLKLSCGKNVSNCTSMLYAQFPFVSANHDSDFVHFLQHIL
jgi:hypothetical protein